MSNPDWKHAHNDATHWDTIGLCFCDVGGWWFGGKYRLCNDGNQEWGTGRYTPRPVEPTTSDWVDGWPPVGWHGECRWGSSVEWFACVVIPDSNVVVQGSAGNWNVVNDLASYDYLFRDTPEADQADRILLTGILNYMRRESDVGVIADKIIELGFTTEQE
jgi:hypothetical protein